MRQLDRCLKHSGARELDAAEFSARVSAATRAAMARPATRAKVISANQKIWASPEVKAKHSASQKARRARERSELKAHIATLGDWTPE